MMCPACCGDSKVIDTRSTTRTRQCKTCGVRWKTHEAVIEGSVVKPGTPKKRARYQPADRYVQEVEQPTNWLFPVRYS